MPNLITFDRIDQFKNQLNKRLFMCLKYKTKVKVS